MRVAELWRYPVKSMRGEPRDAVDVRMDGIVGDRLVHVCDGAGQAVTARTRPDLLRLAGGVGDGGDALVGGALWSSPGAAGAVTEAAGEDARLVEANGVRFDTSPLLVATDGMIESFGIDRRRMRPNVVVEGVDGLAEREWEGRRLRLGEVVIHVDQLCERCVMTTFDPDTTEQDPDVLRRINSELGGLAALNCSVERPGRIALGDPVELL